jgi:hypothetical protein
VPGDGCRSDTGPANFTPGSLLCVSTHTSGIAGIYIQDAKLEKMGESWCVAGIAPDVKGFPNIGDRIWIPMSSISVVYEIKDLEDFRKKMAAPNGPDA